MWKSEAYCKYIHIKIKIIQGWRFLLMIQNICIVYRSIIRYVLKHAPVRVPFLFLFKSPPISANYGISIKFLVFKTVKDEISFKETFSENSENNVFCIFLLSTCFFFFISFALFCCVFLYCFVVNKSFSFLFFYCLNNFVYLTPFIKVQVNDCSVFQRFHGK